jgi:hypothetical protein
MIGATRFLHPIDPFNAAKTCDTQERKRRTRVLYAGFCAAVSLEPHIRKLDNAVWWLLFVSRDTKDFEPLFREPIEKNANMRRFAPGKLRLTP